MEEIASERRPYCRTIENKERELRRSDLICLLTKATNSRIRFGQEHFKKSAHFGLKFSHECMNANLV